MKKKLPFVTIVIPSFNSKDLIEGVVKSALKTKYENFEILIIDDTSTDGSYELTVKKFSKNPQIRIFRNEENTGPSFTRNQGIRNAKGEYIAFIETDMLVDPGWLTPMIKTFERDKKIGATQSRILDINKRNKIHSTGVKFNPHTFWVTSPDCGKDAEDFSKDEIMSIGSVGSVVRASLLKKIGGYDEKLVHNIDDLELGWRIWLAGYKTVFVPEAITYHWTAKPASIRSKVTPTFNSEFHFHKGARIFIKNYEFSNVIRYLPWLLFAYTIRVGKNLAAGNSTPFRAYGKAAVWNFATFEDSLKERKRIQSLRKRSDKEMFDLLGLKGNFFTFYFSTVKSNFKKVNEVFG